jgi:hypothetical protein
MSFACLFRCLNVFAFPSKVGASCMHQTKTPTRSKQHHSPSPISTNSRTHHTSPTTSILPPNIVPDSKGPRRSPLASTHASQLHYAGCRLSLGRRGEVHAVGADYELEGKWGRLMALSLCVSHSLACFNRRRRRLGERMWRAVRGAGCWVGGFIFLSLVSRLALLRTLSSRCMH